MKERVTASISEFARIVGVDHKAVQRSIERGGRLEKSLVKQKGRIRIAVCEGCVEWVLNKDDRRDHTGKGNSGTAGIMPREVSSEMDRHYSALMKQLEYDKACRKVIPVEKYIEEARECLQTFRDTMTNVPLIVSEQLRPMLLGILRANSEDISPAEHKLLEDSVLQLRLVAKREVRKALNSAADMIDERAINSEEKRLNDESLVDA